MSDSVIKVLLVDDNEVVRTSVRLLPSCAPDIKVTGQSKQPTKENVRQWLRQRYLNPRPLPALDQIKLELGWGYQEMSAAQADKQRKNQTVFPD